MFRRLPRRAGRRATARRPPRRLDAPAGAGVLVHRRDLGGRRRLAGRVRQPLAAAFSVAGDVGYLSTLLGGDPTAPMQLFGVGLAGLGRTVGVVDAVARS